MNAGASHVGNGVSVTDLHLLRTYMVEIVYRRALKYQQDLRAGTNIPQLVQIKLEELLIAVFDHEV